MTNSDHQDAVSTVERTVSVTISEATIAKRGDEEQWRLKIHVPWSNYPIPTSMPHEWAQQILGGETHLIKVRRGRLVKETYDGSRDYHYYWDVIEWNAPDESASSSVSTITRPSTSAAHDDRFRTKEELRWTEAMHIAAHLHSARSSIDYAFLAATATKVYKLLDQDTVQGMPVEAPVEPAETAFDEDPHKAPQPSSGSWAALREYVLKFGWTWPIFESQVLGESQADFVRSGGTPVTAWNRYLRYSREHERTEEMPNAGDASTSA